MAGKKYFRWMPGDYAGSEIILGLIFRPCVGQLKYLEDEYRYDLIVFAHFRGLNKLWQARNFERGCRVTVPDRKYYWGPSSGQKGWQLKDLQDQYRYDLIIVAHFRPSKK